MKKLIDWIHRKEDECGVELLIAVLLFIAVLVGALYVEHTNSVNVDNCDRVGGTSVTEYHTGDLMCVTLEVIKL